jgi:flagellar basal body-associated protein FliL
MNYWLFAIASVMVILAVVIAVASVPSIMVSATSYEKSQAITQTNECGNYWFPINVICSNLGSQIQGNENSVTVAAADQEKENVEGSESFAPFP